MHVSRNLTNSWLPQMMPSIETDKHLQEGGGEGCPDPNFTSWANDEQIRVLLHSFIIVLPPIFQNIY
jgi:hypothetical protein